MGVNIKIYGKSSNIYSFLEELQKNPPPLAIIEEIKVEDSLEIFSDFKILNSLKEKNKNTMVSSDMAICDDCLIELFDKNNFRYLYPLINCTNCGPRYSIIKNIPYDRNKTSLKNFPLCSDCKKEYEDPTNRRFHAEAISCEKCGPNSFLYDSNQTQIGSKIKAIDLAADFLNSGKILAIKSMGGFHIVCDATNCKTIKKLREFKNRATKPFAVMFKDINEIKKYCFLNSFEEKLLQTKERPIVLLNKKQDRNLSDLVAPNIAKIGSFLPNSALQHLLFLNLKNPIIATSANIKGEPIITNKEEIFLKLGSLVDFVLDYNRDIVNSCDDSILQVVNEKTIKLRNSRGFTPKSLKIDGKFPKKILSLGANQKSTFSIAFEDKIITSPYLGDLETLKSIENYSKTIFDFMNFYEFKPDIVVCDKHPNYESTKLAKKLKSENENLQIVQVQHHYAHILGVLAEYNIQKDVLAFVFDGTGYGDDKNIWGGEVFIANKKEYQRAYHLNYFKLLSGELAIKEPRRVALSFLFDNFSFDEVLDLDLDCIKSFKKDEIKLLYQIWQKGLNTPQTSSFGRLFDAISSLGNFLQFQSYEGETGLILENYYDKNIKGSFSYSLEDKTIDISNMIKEIVKEKDKKIIASKFINSIVNIIYDISNLYKELPIVLCGGVFQNATLVENILEKLKDRKVYIGEKYSPNDESISLGQAFFLSN